MPFHDKVADFLDDVIPNEIKPYLGTAAAAYAGPALGGMFGGGILQNFLAGAGSDILAQQLLYGSDEDRDTDYLSAGMSGILAGLQGAERGFLGERDPVARTVDTSVPGVETKFKDRLEIGKSIDRTRFPTSQAYEQAVIDAGGALSGKGNYFKSDFLKGLSDFADPFDFTGVGQSATPIRDIIGETTSSLGMLQLGQTPSQVRDAAKALEEAEQRYQNYLDTLEADQRASIEADMNERIAAYKQYMGLAGYTNAEIDEALMNAGYLASGETAYAARGGRIGFANGGTEDDRDEIAYNLFGKPYIELNLDELDELKEEMIRLRNKRATGGRVGFDMGGDTGGMTDRMGLGNYMEAEKVRTEFMDKMKRGLQAAEMNMKLNDPGLMRFVNALVPGGEDFYTREEMRFPSMKERYEANIEKMKRDQAKDDFEKRQLQKQLRKENFDMMVDMVDDRFSENRQQRKMANKGGRMTPQGDPISPDVPNGMQMDLRGGGFIPLGTKPKADDVPAMVGLNEFVLNDEAVSGIGKLITGKPDPRAGARALYQLQDEMEAIV